MSDPDTVFLAALANDTRSAPWMVMSDLQFWPTSSFAHLLRTYRQAQGLPGYVGSMLPIRYTVVDNQGKRRRKQLAPDTFLALVPQRQRNSYNLEQEKVFPAFVLEVVSPSSKKRDEQDKVRAYDVLGALEYALFTPRQPAPSTLQGYRRDEDGRFVPWLLDESGRLWSDVLQLWLVVREPYLQAETPDGVLLLTPEQEAELRRQAEEARRQIEQENARLKAALERALSQESTQGDI
jgi:hypothetical protein